MIYAVLTTALLISSASAITKFPLKKRCNKEFVESIKARAAQGIKPSFRMDEDTGSVVIND